MFESLQPRAPDQSLNQPSTAHSVEGYTSKEQGIQTEGYISKEQGNQTEGLISTSTLPHRQISTSTQAIEVNSVYDLTKTPTTSKSSPELQSTKSDQNVLRGAHQSSPVLELQHDSDQDDNDCTLEDDEVVEFLNGLVQPSSDDKNEQSADSDLSQPPLKRRRIESHSPSTSALPPHSPSAPEIAPWTSQSIPSKTKRTLARDGSRLFQRSNGEIDRSSSRSRTTGRTSRPSRYRANVRAPGLRDEEGYLLRLDGTRDKRSVLFVNSGRRNSRKHGMPKGDSQV